MFWGHLPAGEVTHNPINMYNLENISQTRRVKLYWEMNVWFEGIHNSVMKRKLALNSKKSFAIPLEYIFDATWYW
jgi:hypothetical protein